MDGLNSHTSKVINAYLLLSGIALNHSMAPVVLFHRFCCLDDCIVNAV